MYLKKRYGVSLITALYEIVHDKMKNTSQEAIK